MDASLDFSALVAGLADGVDEFRTGVDEDGRAVIEIGDDLLLGLDHLAEAGLVALHVELGRLPHDGASGAIAVDLLHGTLELAATVGGTLAADAATGTVALFARRPLAGFTPESFEAWVGDCAEAAQVWSRRLPRRADAPEVEPD